MSGYFNHDWVVNPEQATTA